MIFKFREIEQTPRESVETTYRLILMDYREGLNYPVSRDLYNKHIKILGGSEVVSKSVSAKKYLNDICKLLKKKKEVNDL